MNYLHGCLKAIGYVQCQEKIYVEKSSFYVEFNKNQQSWNYSKFQMMIKFDFEKLFIELTSFHL